jgi:hypothetical protein
MFWEIGEEKQQQQPEAVGPVILPFSSFFPPQRRRVGLSFSSARRTGPATNT